MGRKENKLKTVTDDLKKMPKERSLSVDSDQKMTELEKRIEQLMKDKHKTQLQITDKDGNIMELERGIAELEVSATNSDKLNSIVKEKNNQIVILRKSQEDYQSELVKLETK